MNPLWIDAARAPDRRVMFRGAFELPHDAEVELRLSGASWFVANLDGEFLAEGPNRFDAAHSDYIAIRKSLAKGRHLVTAMVIDEGVATKRIPTMSPFFACDVILDDKPLPIDWRCRAVAGQRAQTRRINGDLGWIDWLDTRADPPDWQHVDFDDSSWPKPKPKPADVKLDNIAASDIGAISQWPHKLTPIAHGFAADALGYAEADPPARFFLRDLACDRVPPQGVWRRYDLGRVRLGRMVVTLDLPAGAVVEIGYAEQLRSDRVAPWITLSNGQSCNLDHFVARGGAQTFTALTPKSGRFAELHVISGNDRAKIDQIKFIDEQFVERSFHGEPVGHFECDDDLLNRIWRMGVETYRACAEDAIIDNPTRERGQWTGDALVGLETAAVAYGDFRLVKRMLRQTGATTRGNAHGMVECLSPSAGKGTVISSYAAQWIVAAVRYAEHTGDLDLLRELLPDARRNRDGFAKFVTDDGLADATIGWSFIDWGYETKPAEAGLAGDPCANLHYLSGLRAMTRWCRWIDARDDTDRLEITAKRQAAVIRRWIDHHATGAGAAQWDALGFHVTALALAAGLVRDDETAGAVESMKRHIKSCFPNDPDAPRLSDPSVHDRRLITPYFTHFAFPPLIEGGQVDFVLDQYRKCWGWMLTEIGATTCLEVFDRRWSHCHQWSACPTWQLSRYVLGLHPRFDRGMSRFDLRLFPGALTHARGALPLAGGGHVDVTWTRAADRIQYGLKTTRPIRIDEEEVRDEWRTVVAVK